MIKIDATKAAELELSNRKAEIHEELDALDRRKIIADREGNSVLSNALDVQSQELISELRTLLK